MPNTQIEITLTKIASIFAATMTVGGVIAGINSILQTFCLLLTMISFILIIAVNWDKGVDRIRKWLNLKHDQKVHMKGDKDFDQDTTKNTKPKAKSK